jgi:hypothetical protein
MKLVNDSCHDIQDFRLAGVRNVSVVVQQDGFQKRWNHIGIDHLQVIGLLDICVDEFQDLLLDSAKPANFWSLRCDGP